jgi:hypothetical protein
MSEDDLRNLNKLRKRGTFSTYAFVNKKGRFMAIRLFVFLFYVYVSMGLAGCTPRSWFEGLRETERQNCYKIMSPTERQECLDKLDESYGQYQHEREEAKKQ